MQFFIEVLVGGLLAGLMYSLVALGFVLIYKASGVFNFAQGAMNVALCGVGHYVTIVEHGAPFWLALVATLVIMLALALVIEHTRCAATAGEPPAHDPVHGHAGPELRD